MLKIFSLAFTFLALLMLQSASLARGRGTQSYLVDANGQVTAALGETGSDLLDPAAFVRYRYDNGRVTAVPLDKPTEVLWSAAAKPQLSGRAPVWYLLPGVLVVIGEDTITGIDRATGKVLYDTRAEGFTRDLSLLKLHGENDTPPEPALYLIDTTPQDVEPTPRHTTSAFAARLARFDPQTGKFLWKNDMVTAAGVKIRPRTLQPNGTVEGQNMDEVCYFDPTTGKALDKPYVPKPSGVDPFANHVWPKEGEFSLFHHSPDKIIAEDPTGKRLWVHMEPGQKGFACTTADSLIIPIITDRIKIELLALQKKDGTPRWRTPLPLGRFADQVTVQVHQAKSGYLVNVEWIVLD